MNDQNRGSVRKRGAFSLFTRPKPAQSITIISAPVALSPNTGAAAGIPGFVPQPPVSTSTMVATATAILAPISTAKPLDKTAQVKAERAMAWAAQHATAPPVLSSAATTQDHSESLRVASVPGAEVGRETLLLPTSFSTGSGLTASSSIQCISASTSRNTVLPALHPILNTSASGQDIRAGGLVSPSNSLGQQGMPSLASAIKLGPGLTATTDSTTVKPIAATAAAPSPVIRTAILEKSSTLPRSISGTSVFTIHRQSTRKVSNDVASGTNESLSRRISRRLSIDGFRPKFGGGSHKRRSVMDVSKGVTEFGSIVPDSKPVEQAAPAAAPIPTAPASDAVPGKEKMMLPGFRSWRTRFKNNPTSSSAEGSTEKLPLSRPASGAKRDSWVDVGSVRSRMSKMRVDVSGQDELGRAVQLDERSRPIGSTSTKARIVTGGSEHENVYRRSFIEPSVTAEEIDAKVERLIGKYEITTKSSDATLPKDAAPKLDYKLASQSSTSLAAPTLNTVIPSSRFSPANDDMSVLDPLQSRRASPEPPLPPLPASMLVSLNGDKIGGQVGLPSSRSLNALDSFSHISNSLDHTSPGGGADAKATIGRKRSMVAVGSSTFGTAEATQNKPVKVEHSSENQRSATYVPQIPSGQSTQTKSRPVSTITTFDLEADVSIVTATRHERLPFARSYSGSIADHLSILSASSSGLEVSGMIDSRASIASIAAPLSAPGGELQDRDGQGTIGRDESMMTFHTAPSANSVSGLPTTTISRATVKTHDNNDDASAPGAPSASPPGAQHRGIEPSPSLIEKTEKQQGEGWWSVSRKSRIGLPSQEMGSPTRAKATAATFGRILARPKSGMESPQTESPRKRSSKTVSFPAEATSQKRTQTKEGPERLPGKASQIERPSKSERSVEPAEPARSASKPAPESDVTETMAVATSQTSIALSLICPSPPAPSGADQTLNAAARGAAIPLALAPAVTLSPSARSIPDQLRTMRDKHERELDAILDSLYQAKVERDRANARSYRIYRDWQAALRRAESAEADQCDGPEKRDKLHSAAVCHDQCMTELKDKTALVKEMGEQVERTERKYEEALRRIKYLEKENSVLSEIISACSNCEHRSRTTSRIFGSSTGSPAAYALVQRPTKVRKHTSTARLGSQLPMALSPALPSAPSDNMISKTTPLPDVQMADPPEYREKADALPVQQHAKVFKKKQYGPMNGDMSRSDTGSGSETVCEPELQVRIASADVGGKVGPKQEVLRMKGEERI